MSFFKRLLRPKIEGELGYFGLGDWWLDTFTDKERAYIEHVFQPLSMGGGTRPLTQGKIDSTTQRAASLLSGLAGWFTKGDDLSIAVRMLDKAQAVVGSNVLDQHFLYQQVIKTYLSFPSSDADAKAQVIRACEQQIALAPEAAKAFKKEEGPKLPGHEGYERLIMIHERNKDYPSAIALCKQAKKQKWAGEWDDDIERLKVKSGKQ